jgi:lysophospholipid acyltransferase (LPLAT)-like uncharacterized protein
MSETDPPPQTPQQPSDARPQLTASRVRRFRLACFGRVTAWALRLLGATWRVEIIGHDPREVVRGRSPGSHDPSAQLAALFHESMIPCAWFYRDAGYSVAVSRSRDGDLIQATLLALGYSEPARGSSSRGGSAALRGLVRQVGEGTTAAVLVDGPRGPARVAKSGIISLARMTQTAIQTVAFSARPAIRLGSWDRSLIPLPFARVVCAYGEPIQIGPESDPDGTTEQRAARQLDKALTALHHEADGALLGRR